MSNIDEQIKREINTYLNKSINFSSDEKMKIQNAIHSKKRNNFMYYSIFSLTAVLSLLLFITLIQDEEVSYEMTPSPFSSKSGLEKELPDREREEVADLKEEKENQSEDGMDSEENEDQSQSDFKSEVTVTETETEEKESETEVVEKEEESKGTEGQHDTKEQKKEQSAVDEEPMNENEKTEEGQETPNENIGENDPLPNIDDESVFLNLMYKFNSMQDVVLADVDPNDYSEEAPGYKHKTLTSKEQVYALLSDYMSRGLAEYFWKERLAETEEGLFQIPMDKIPAWFVQSDPYQIKKINDETYQLMQTIESGMYGKLNLTFTMKKLEGKWLLTECSAN
ncbi:hypothetical protein [Oceanobacillus chungangensis]|uniref:Uncharacterized protein n=1 Tax=Oceanobacillus chungangensis TaxID=1229152 RepID=A0A3D8PX94_9BACI|nr:hypothetical protein [Oceanobacillus chungangensis]RDW20644.1 hypothetical protein CWR45_05275 [Oceanobacillus chungangensis]